MSKGVFYMFRPCIDIHEGQVKQIVGGTLSSSEDKVIENYVSINRPAHYATMFKEDQLKGGHVIMLGPGNEEAALEALTAYPKGLQVGGGITDENAKFYLNNGASHVIVTSYVFKDGVIHLENLKKLTNLIGKDKLVLDLSCRKKDEKYYVVTDRWQKFTEFEVNAENMDMLSGYCSEFLVHGVDVEGKIQGIEIELVKLLAQWNKIPITYAGGIRSFEDIQLINKLGNGNIHFTVGSALDIFGGELSYDQVVTRQYDK